jgi:R3H domain
MADTEQPAQHQGKQEEGEEKEEKKRKEEEAAVADGSSSNTLQDSSAGLVEEVGTLPGTAPRVMADPNRKHKWFFIPDPPATPQLLRIFLLIKEFVTDDSRSEFSFPADLSREDRKRVHMCAAHFRGLVHKSRGSKMDGMHCIICRLCFLCVRHLWMGVCLSVCVAG